MTIKPTDAQRSISYQARRGLKELDFYIDYYVKSHYLSADADEQQAFETLLSYEDPDLLVFFLGQETPSEAGVAALIDKMKSLRHTGTV